MNDLTLIQLRKLTLRHRSCRSVPVKRVACLPFFERVIRPIIKHLCRGNTRKRNQGKKKPCHPHTFNCDKTKRNSKQNIVSVTEPASLSTHLSKKNRSVLRIFKHSLTIPYGTSSLMILSLGPHFFIQGHFLPSRVQGHRQLSPVMQGSWIKSSLCAFPAPKAKRWNPQNR